MYKRQGIYQLTDFLMKYEKGVLVISHDAEFLNAFTQGVLYLDSFTKKIEQYAGDYNDVVEQIALRIEKEKMLNARMERGIQENKDRANFFAHKGGRLRQVAKKMREKADEMESSKVEVRREDKTIRPFTIPNQDDIVNEEVRITSFKVVKDHKEEHKTTDILLSKGKHLLIEGPNGIGKSTFIDSLLKGTAEGVSMTEGVRVGIYKQDFSMLNPEDTVYESLCEMAKQADGKIMEQHIRSLSLIHI